MINAACIVTNYNYGKFIVECIDSIKKQDYPNLQIIIVDDGSSDDSLTLIKDISGIKIVKKANGGQLSAFNAGFMALDKTCEIVFFLDADDLMNENYIKQCVEIFTQNASVDYIFCESCNLKSNGEKDYPKSVYNANNLGFGLYATYFLKEYFGNSTSTISIRKSTLSKILPLDLESEWRIRADDCIIYGVSLIGGNIYHLDFYGITYRIHGENNHYSKDYNNAYLFKRELAIERLFKILLERNHIYFSTSSLYLEFLNANTKHKKRKYLKITLLSKLSIFHKIGLIIRILIF